MVKSRIMEGWKSWSNKVSVGRIIYILAIIVCIAYFIIINTAPNNGMFKCYRPTITVSGSMLPEIPINSIGIMGNVEYEEIEVGDIIIYNNPILNIKILHRVNEIVEEDGIRYLIMKGDANDRVDQGYNGEPLYVDRGMVEGELVYNLDFTASIINIFSRDGIARGSEVTAGMVVLSILVGAIIYTSVEIIKFVCSITCVICKVHSKKISRRLKLAGYSEKKIGKIIYIQKGDSIGNIFCKSIIRYLVSGYYNEKSIIKLKKLEKFLYK